ncbi:hypothetical protein AVEN_221643-1 [Araneus ventricosus]|uniref:Uncharacterized protein n=1 Tax=Araneus ventricosus TaxID=182803 RepID=A0A4Y2SNR2_ARAVE|nr:hypothetical protein AVEN_167000-1 [Araneus ventricosus]GBN89819.1 hypothetical protein AVEN_221643-1 [Araneus ventricosus]
MAHRRHRRLIQFSYKHHLCFTYGPIFRTLIGAPMGSRRRLMLSSRQITHSFCDWECGFAARRRWNGSEKWNHLDVGRSVIVLLCLNNLKGAAFSYP